MWNITLEAKEIFERSNLLPIHETDDEWEIVLREAKEEGEDIFQELRTELDEIKEELYQIVPKRFHPYIENGTLNQPSLPVSVREDYLSWIQERDEAFEQILTLASEQTEKAVEQLSENVQEVFKDSLHDSQIKKIDRNADSIKLVLDSGGFSKMERMYLQFYGVSDETSNEPLTAEERIVYYEMQQVNDDYYFRILTDELEWTVAFTDLTAYFYFRPAIYTQLDMEDKLAELTPSEYIQQLNPKQNYWLITPEFEQKIIFLNGKLAIERGKLEINEEFLKIIDSEKEYIYPSEEYQLAELIYTDVYENPEEFLEEMLPADEIIPAIFGENTQLQIQAWNTMYTDPLAYKEEINQVLDKIQLTEENEMLLLIYIEHFKEYSILKSSILTKFKTLLEGA